MTVAIGDEPLRRHFVAIATAHYDDPHYGPLKVADEVEVLAAWLSDADRLGARAFTRRYPELALDPDEDAIRRVFRSGEARWNFLDAAVVFVTGHGETVDRDHWTVLSGSDQADLPGTALRTADLVRWLLRPGGAQDLLLIVDSCFSGELARSLLRFDDPIPDRWLIIPSAERDGLATTGALTGAIAATVRRLRGREGEKYGTVSPYFTVGDFVDAIREALPNQSFTPIYRGLYNAGHVCLPNPHYVASTTAATGPHRSDLALPLADMESHWIPRLRGSDEDLGGFYFSGRTRLMAELVRRTSATGPVLVTGGAGAGKSAALARLVTLSDPVFRRDHAAYVDSVAPDQLPPSEAVDVAVLATGKHQAEILDQLVGALADGGPAPAAYKERISWCQQRITARRESGRGTVIVLDALDEALDPLAVVRLLGYLLEVGGLSLLVGVRSTAAHHDDDPTTTPDLTLVGRIRELLNGHGVGVEEVRVDADHWWSDADIVEYVNRLLTGLPGSPYEHAGAEEVAITARAVVRRADRSFLVARLGASWLASAEERVDPDDPSWRAVLDEGVAGVFGADLEQAFPFNDTRSAMVDVLRAVSFAEGRGLPWGEVWPAMANAVADAYSRYGDRDIAELLASRISGYLVRDVDCGVTVYRLFHDALRSALRGGPDQSAVQERIAHRLTRFADKGGAAWERVPPYVREHLAEHAAAGGALDALAHDVGFVAAEDPTRMSTALATLGGARTLAPPLARAYLRLGADRVGDTFGERAANLVSAVAVGASAAGLELRDLVERLPWRLDLTRTATVPDIDGVSLAGIRVTAFAAQDTATGALVVADFRHRLQVWDGPDGPLLRSWDAHLDRITAVELTELADAGWVVVSGGDDRAVRVWRLSTGDPLTRFDLDSAALCLAVLKTAAGTVAVVGCADGTVSVLDLVTEETVVTWHAHEDAVTSVAAFWADEVVVVSGSLDRSLRVTKATDGVPTHTFVGPSGSVLGVTLGNRGAPTTVVASYADESVWLWRLDGREPREFVGHTAGVNSVDISTVAGRSVLASAGADTTVRLWDVESGTPLAVLRGHGGEVEWCRFVVREGRPILLSAGVDRGVRKWEVIDLVTRADWGTPFPAEPSGPALPQITAVRGLAVFPAGDGPAVAMGGMDGMIRLLDAGGETVLARPAHDGPVLALSTVDVDGSVLLASAGQDGLIRLWEPYSGKPVYDWETDASVWGLAAGRLGDRPDRKSVV